MNEIDVVLRRHIQPSSAQEFIGMQEHVRAIDDEFEISRHPHVVMFHAKKIGKLTIEEAANIVYPLPKSAKENLSVTPTKINCIKTSTLSNAVVVEFTDDSLKECREEQTFFINRVEDHIQKKGIPILGKHLYLVLGYLRCKADLDTIKADVSQSMPDRINLQTLNVGPVALRQAMLRARQTQTQRSFFTSLGRSVAN